MSAKRLFNLVCSANGCVFLKEGLGKRAAEREATSHGATCPGHSVLMVEQKPKENRGVSEG